MDVDTNEILSNDLVFFFLELINFTKEESELVTNLDKWLYLFKNISKLDKIPAAFQTDIFEKVFHIAAYRNMNKEEKHMYDLALKHKWDSENKLDYATEQGILKGREEGREEGIVEGIAKGRAEGRAEGIAVERNNTQQRLNRIAHYFHTQGNSIDEIASIMQLSAQEVEEIIQHIVSK
jgi:predicted transposase/invertase (TIGR01784 family)